MANTIAELRKFAEKQLSEVNLKADKAEVYKALKSKYLRFKKEAQATKELKATVRATKEFTGLRSFFYSLAAQQWAHRAYLNEKAKRTIELNPEAPKAAKATIHKVKAPAKVK